MRNFNFFFARLFRPFNRGKAMANNETQCRACGYEINQHSQLTDETSTPKPGDISVCLNCGIISIFDANGNPIEPTEIERLEIENDPEVQKIRKAIDLLNSFKRTAARKRPGHA